MYDKCTQVYTEFFWRISKRCKRNFIVNSGRPFYIHCLGLWIILARINKIFFGLMDGFTVLCGLLFLYLDRVSRWRLELRCTRIASCVRYCSRLGHKPIHSPLGHDARTPHVQVLAALASGDAFRDDFSDLLSVDGWSSGGVPQT